MLLFFQNFKNIIKEKIQVVIFIILAALLAMVAIGSWNVSARLQEGYNFMGQGTFDYNYLFKFGSKGQSQNGDETISPSMAFDYEWHTITPDSKDASQTWTMPYWGITHTDKANNVLGALKSLDPLSAGNVDINYVTDGNNKVTNLSFNLKDDKLTSSSLKYEDDALFAFNYDSPHFQDSAIGQLFIKGTSELKNPENKILIENYMNNFAYSVYGQGIIQLIINRYNGDKNSLTWSNIADFVNPSVSSPNWIKDVSDATISDFQNADIKTLENTLKTSNLDGNFSFLAVQDTTQKLDINNIYNVFAANQSTTFIPFSAAYYNNYNYGTFTVNDLYNVDANSKFTNHSVTNDINQSVWIGPYYLSTSYWDIIAKISNMKLEINQQYAIWDSLSNQKIKIIDWKNLVASNRLRIIEKVAAFDPYDLTKNVENSVYTVITSSYAKAHNLKLGDSITIGSDPYLFVGAIGGDVTNIYPTIYDTDIFPDSQTDGIVYVDDTNYQQSIMFANKDITDSSTVFVTNISGDVKNNGNNFINFLAADFRHLNNPLANNVTVSSREDSKIIYLRYSLLGETIFVYQLVSVVLFIIFAVILVFTISVLLKKIMDQERVANGILKANGYSNWKISLSYSPYAIMLTLIGVPVGWALALIFELVIMNVFNNYFIIPHNFLYGFAAFGILFVIVGLLSLGSILFTAINQLRVSPLHLISPHSVIKSSRAIDALLVRAHFKSFWPRFNLTIFSVSYKQIIYFFLTFLAASIALTFVALLPTSINKIRSDYYKNLNYNNEYNYNNIVGNNPLTRYQEYNWNGPNANSTDPLYPLNKNSLVPEYYTEISDNKLSINWNKTRDIPYESASDVNTMLINNLLALRGASFSIGTLVDLIQHYHNPNLTNQLYTLSCTFLPQLFHQPPVDVVNPDPADHIFTCINKALSPILPAQIKEQWSKDPISEEQFNLTFGTTALNQGKEDLYTGYQMLINNSAGKSLNVYGINSLNKTITLPLGLQKELDNSTSLLKATQPESDIANVNIPMVISDYTLKTFGLSVGQIIQGQLDVPTLEYTIDGKNYLPVAQNNDPTSNLGEGWKYLINENNATSDANLNNDDLSKFSLGDPTQLHGKWYGYSSGKTIKPYYNLDNIELVLKANAATQIAPQFTSKINDKYDPLLVNKDNVINVTQQGNNKFYLVHPYSGLYSGYPMPIDVSNTTNWYREAIATGLLKVINVPKTINYNIIGVQNSYDSPRAFINQKLANAVLGYPINDKFDLSTVWFNGKFSQFLDETDQTTRYNLVPTDGSYTLTDLAGNGLSSTFVSSIGRTDYLGLKQQVINHVALISMILTAVFILVIILTAIIIIYIITEGFVNKFLKFIAVMKAMGYSNWEISRFILTIFAPFVVLAWLIGTFVMWWVLKLVVVLVLNYTSMILPINFPWLLIPITLSLVVIIFVITFLLSKQKIIHMSIQQQVNSNEQ